MSQLALLLEPGVRTQDPETSHAAAASAKELQAHHHAVILGALRKHGPAGKDRLGALTNLTGVQICRRLTELHRAGQIEPTGRNVQSTAGRAEREWRLAQA
jgi:predicted ArsR family transcriptional regulator